MITQNTNLDFNEGFNDQTDIFNRVGIYKSIINLCENSPEKNLVLALDDQWGEGKTTFVQMMKGQIEKDCGDKFNAIYFDAFENDFHSDPFISISAEFYSLIEKKDSKLEKFKDSFVKITKKVGAATLIGGLKAVINTSSLGLVNGDKVVDASVEAAKNASENLTSSLEQYIQKKITTANEEKKDISTFKATLSEMHIESGKKTIFIIDELDRARPDYSLDLLEKIKHLFSVEGVVFLLVMNRAQFEKCIEKRYGYIDSSAYLNKFINFYFTLPKISQHEITDRNQHRNTTIHRYIRELVDGKNLLSINGTLHNSLSYLLGSNGCSLRECERCLSLLSAIRNPQDTIMYMDDFAVALAFIIFLKVKNPVLLERFLQKKIDFQNLTTEIVIFNNSSIKIEAADLLTNVINFHYLTTEDLKKDFNKNRFSDFLYPQYENPFVYFNSKVKNFSLS